MNLAGDLTEQNVIKISIGTILLSLVAFEASLMGSGRLLMVGPLTLKMWLFLFAQVYVVFRMFGQLRLNPTSIVLLFTLIVLLVFGVLIGMIRQTPMEFIGEDVSPLLYCFMLIFVEITMSTVNYLRYVMRIIEIAAVIMSSAYVVFWVLLFTGVFNFIALYRLIATSNSEVAFRGESGLIFYKGSLYIGVGLIYFAFRKSWQSKICSFALFIGLLATGTRGFILGMAVAVVAHIVTGAISVRKRFIYVAILIATVAFLAGVSTLVLSDKSKSDLVRVTTVDEVIDGTVPASFIFGNGFGVGVPARPNHMEISYLEIFQKQGLLGLTWWSVVTLLITIRYYRARRINYDLAQPLFLSFIFIATVSGTNPFINNPIGIFIWIVAFVGLDLLSKDAQTTAIQEQNPRLAY